MRAGVQCMRVWVCMCVRALLLHRGWLNKWQAGGQAAGGAAWGAAGVASDTEKKEKKTHINDFPEESLLVSWMRVCACA